MNWILLVLFYGIAKGFRDVIKKKSFTKNTVMEVLFAHTFITFVFCIPDINNSLGIPSNYYFLIALKSLAIFLAWIFSFNAIDNMPISVYGIVDLSRIIFSTLFGVLILKETISLSGGIGLSLVLLGLLLLKLYPKIKEKLTKNSNHEVNNSEEINPKYVIMAFLSCLLNGLSGGLDKIYTKDVSSSQLQFWYMLFMVIYYAIYILARRIKIRSSIWKNGWLWLLSILFFLADKALFIANTYPESKVSIMTLIKQSACIITIFAGKFIFKEKNIGYKFICALIVVSGIIIATI